VTALALVPSATATASTQRPATQLSAADQRPYSLPKNVRRVCPAPGPGRASCLALVATAKRRIAAPLADVMQAPYGPAALQSAYNLPSSIDGQGQTVAIVDAFEDPALENDLAVYRSTYGLPPCTTANGCFRKLNQDGQQGNYPAADSGWAGEESLDVDMVSAICPNCHIVVVEASSAYGSDLSTAENTAIQSGAKFISNSWGGSFQIPGWPSHPGVVVTASTGDNGFGVSYPAAFTDTVAIGGTSLLPAANSRGWAEIAWPGGGSGCSSEPKPSWQTDSGCSGHTVADVSAVADPFTGVNIYDSDPLGPTAGWGQIGGTSVSSPIVAAVYALGGNPGPNAGASVMYAHPSMLNDIVTGMNDALGCTPAYLCNAGPGYDAPTGLGTPDGISAFQPAPGPIYTSMGDSYSAGEGDENYDPGTDTATNQCHRSSWAFGRLYAESVGLTIEHIACSGAVIPDVMFTGQGGEAPQIDQLNPQSKLVTITIGGNDIGFASIVARCLIPFTSCKAYYTQNDDNNLDNKIDGLRSSLAAVYTEIKDKAPNATVVAVTYPSIFTPNQTCLGAGRISVDDINWLITETNHLDDVIVAATRDAGILQLDLRAIFDGHQLCDADPWVFTLTPNAVFGGSDKEATFHPTPRGQQEMAKYLQRDIGPLS